MTKWSDRLSRLTDEQKACFLEFLSHEITLAIRGLVSEPELSAEQRLAELFWLNEVHHRVPMRSRSLRRREKDWIGPDLGLDLAKYATEDRHAAHRLRQAVERSIEFAENEDTPIRKPTVL